MPFPFKKAVNAQQFAAQLAWDYEAHEGEENELDAFIDNINAAMGAQEGALTAEEEEERERLQRLHNAALELRDASKRAAQQMLKGRYSQARESLAEAEDAAARMAEDLQTLREVQGPEGFAAEFINGWDSPEQRPHKKYMALAGSHTPDRMPRHLSDQEKWRWVVGQNTGADTPFYRHEDKVTALAMALAAYKFENDKPSPSFSEKRLQNAANALKKDPVFQFLTAGEMGPDTYLREANLAVLSQQVSNRFIISVDPEELPPGADLAGETEKLKDRLNNELDELGDFMKLDPPAKGRSKEWKALHESLAGYRKHPEMSTEERIQQVFNAIEAYGKDKKTLRSTTEGQASFDMMMRALAIVSKASPAAKARADAIVADINHARTHRPFFRKSQPTVDLEEYTDAKLRYDVEQTVVNRLGRVPGSIRDPKPVNEIERELRKGFQRFGVETTDFDMNNAEQVEAVTKLIASSVALTRIPQYRESYKNLSGEKRFRRAVDPEQLNLMTGELTRDPVIREMARRYMTQPEFRKNMLTTGTEWKELPATVIADRMAEEYAGISKEKNWKTAQIDYMANTVGPLDSEFLPALPKGVKKPVLLEDVMDQIQPFRNIDNYKNTLEFTGQLEDALAKHIALSYVPAYRQKDPKSGEYRKVIDADAHRAKAEELKKDPSLKALAKRMADDPEYRRQVLLDLELAKKVGIPEGMPIPARSHLSLAGKLTTELMRTKDKLRDLPEFDAQKEADASAYRREIEKNIVDYGRGYIANNSEKLKADMLEHVANTLAYADTKTELRRKDGNIVPVTDPAAYREKVNKLKEDPAVKEIAENFAKNTQSFYDAVRDPIWNGVSSAADFAAKIKKQYQYIKEAPIRELKDKIETTRRANAGKWQKARENREAREAQPAGKKAAPLQYDENGIPLPPGAGAAEKKAEAVMAVNIKYSTKPEDLPIPDKEIKPVEVKTLRNRSTNLAKISGYFNPKNVDHVATMTGSMLTALAMNTLPAWQGQVNGQPACVADAGELDKKISELQKDPAVQTILDRSMKDPDYLIDLTYVRERGTRPMPRNAMKFAERMQQEVDAVRKELGPNAAGKEQEKEQEKPEMEQEGAVIL